MMRRQLRRALKFSSSERTTDSKAQKENRVRGRVATFSTPRRPKRSRRTSSRSFRDARGGAGGGGTPPKCGRPAQYHSSKAAHHATKLSPRYAKTPWLDRTLTARLRTQSRPQGAKSRKPRMNLLDGIGEAAFVEVVRMLDVHDACSTRLLCKEVRNIIDTNPGVWAQRRFLVPVPQNELPRAAVIRLCRVALRVNPSAHFFLLTTEWYMYVNKLNLESEAKLAEADLTQLPEALAILEQDRSTSGGHAAIHQPIEPTTRLRRDLFEHCWNALCYLAEAIDNNIFNCKSWNAWERGGLLDVARTVKAQAKRMQLKAATPEPRIRTEAASKESIAVSEIHVPHSRRQAGSVSPILADPEVFHNVAQVMLENDALRDALGTIALMYEWAISKAKSRTRVRRDLEARDRGVDCGSLTVSVANAHAIRSFDMAGSALASERNSQGSGPIGRFSRRSATPLNLSHFSRAKVTWLSVYEEFVIVISKNGLGAIYDASSRRTEPLSFLNLATTEAVHCVYVNDIHEPPHLLWCYSDLEGRLRCRAAPFAAFKSGSMRVHQTAKELFTSERMFYPGFIEFNEDNHLALTRAAGRFTLWNMNDYTSAFHLDFEDLTDVKFAGDFLMAIHRVPDRDDLTRTTLFSLRTRRWVKSFTLPIEPGAEQVLCEMFCGKLMIKQRNHPLRIIDIATQMQTTAANAEQPYAHAFLHDREMFLSVYSDRVELYRSDGTLLQRLSNQEDVGRALHGIQQTGSHIHLTRDQECVLMLGVSLLRRQTANRSRFRGGHGSVLLYSIAHGRVIAKLWSRSPRATPEDRQALRGASAFRFVPSTHEMVTGDLWGTVTLWRAPREDE